MGSYVKDPDARLDYATDWSTWLGEGEVIDSHVVTVSGPDAALALDGDDASATVVTAWLIGGTAGAEYRVGYRVTTNQGRTDERSDTIYVMER
jgi:hypothetical protein